MDKPKYPNILVTGTPGVGKTTFSQMLAEELGFTHINVGEIVRERGLHDGRNEEFDSLELNEDKLCDELEVCTLDGNIIFWPESPVGVYLVFVSITTHGAPLSPHLFLFFVFREGAPLGTTQISSSTAVSYPPTAVYYPPTAVGCRPTAIGHHPNMTDCMVTHFLVLNWGVPWLSPSGHDSAIRATVQP